MSLNEWVEHLLMGREIEFHFHQDAFLISYIPDTDPLQFRILNGTKHFELCCGDLDCVLDFEFDRSVSLRNAAGAFTIDYIL